MIIAICGLPGSGKTYFSKQLARALNLARFSTDELRAELKQLGIYDEGSRLAVYQKIAKRILPSLLREESIIIDGSFNNKAQRQEIAAVAQRVQTPLVFIQCHADEATSLARVNQTRDYTEADSRVYYLLKELWEGLEPPFLSLDTANESLEERLKKTRVYLQTFK
ncbi:MAG: ATP-binding protein [Trueperaceae bacterium]|nr:ATP-binding protein [Trueperaceae bacterium]